MGHRIGAIINYYHGDAQVKALCETLEVDLRAVCLQTAEEHYETSFPD